MFKNHFKDDVVATIDRSKEAKIVMNGHPFSKETIIGIGITAVGAVVTMFGCWKAGGRDYSIGEWKALNEIGVVTENKPE